MIVLKRNLLAAVLVIFLVVSVVAFEDVSYHNSPFNPSWKQNFGQVINPTGVGSLIKNGELFILSVIRDNYTYGTGTKGMVLTASNISDGTGLWTDSFIIEYPGVPLMYWNNGSILIVSYANGFSIGNNGLRQFSNYNVLMLKFNPETGSVTNISRYNNSFVSNSNPLKVYGNELFGWSFQVQGTEYYIGGVPTVTFELGIFGLNLSSMKSWNQTFYVQGNPDNSSPSILVSNSTVAIVSNNIYTGAPEISNLSFFAFNSHSGNSSWAFSSGGSYSGLWSVSDNFYFVRYANMSYSLVTLNSVNGHEVNSIPIPGSNVIFVQGKILYSQDGYYSAISQNGSIMWNMEKPFSSPVNSYSTVKGLSPGYALISTIGSPSVYHVINLSTGKTVWSSDHSLITSIMGGSGVEDVPITYGDGYIVFVILTQDYSNLNVMAVNINTLSINS